jgi:hypothetical protein
MANYLDGMDGGKHNSDNIEHKDRNTTFTVNLTFTDIDAKNPLEAVNTIIEWLEDARTMVYDVTDELTGEKFTVDLSEADEDAVLPVIETPIRSVAVRNKEDKENLIADIQKIIKEFGSFTTADIEADCDVSLPTTGNLIHLANHFAFEGVGVEVYENGGQNEIDSYKLSYRDMDLDTLEEVFKYAQDYEAMCLQDEDRQGVNQ